VKHPPLRKASIKSVDSKKLILSSVVM